MSVADQEIADMALTPIVKSATKNTTVGMAARSLYAVFAANLENKTTRCVVELAIDVGMTCAEYDEAESGAIAIAKTEDVANGWNPPASVKGRAKYGPRQSSCASMASQRRQVFGAVRLGGMGVVVSVPDSGLVNFDTLPTWNQAVIRARDYLANPTGAEKKEDRKPVDWTGKPTADKRREKADMADVAMSDAAMEQARKSCPKQPGETYAAWTMRVLESDAYGDALEEITEKARTDKVAKMAKTLIEEHGESLAEDVARAVLNALGYDIE